MNHNSPINTHPKSYLYKQVRGLQEFIEASPILTLAFEFDGFIAGGFLNTCLRQGFFDPSDYDGDIDIFFASTVGSKLMQQALNDLKIDYAKGLHAKNVIIDTITYQIITYRCFAPVNTLNGFDIDNAKVALSKNVFYESSTRKEHEEKNEIHLCMGGFSMHDKIMYRLPKYFRKGYTSISDESKSLIRTWFENMLPMPVPRDSNARERYLAKVLEYDIPDIREQRLYANIDIHSGKPSILDIAVSCFPE